ncbi:MAG: YitT family protein [Bacilli bacterium]
MKLKFNKSKMLEWVYITIGVMIASLSVSFFLDPIDLVIGGVTGLGVIFKALLHRDISFYIFIINMILLVVGLIFLGKSFFLKTAYGSIIFPVFVKLFNMLYKVAFTEPIMDKILVVLFSSLLMGIGLGIVIKYGGTTGGSEIPQNILLKYFHIPYSVSLYLIDGLVIMLGYFVFKEITDVLYGLVYIYLSGLVVDRLVFSGFNKRAVYIISSECDKIKERILVDLGRGVTQIKVVGGFSNTERNKLVCVLSSFEFYKLKKIIEEYDPHAFFYVVRADEVSGEGFTYGK